MPLVESYSRRTSSPSRFVVCVHLASALLASMPEAAAAERAPDTSAEVRTTRSRREIRTFILGSPYADLGLFAVSLGMGAIGTFALDPPTEARPPFNGGRHVEANDAAAMASNVTFGAAVGGAFAFSFLIEHREGRRRVDLLRAPLVVAESVAFSLGVVALLKNVLGECRPRAWDEATASCVGTTPGRPTEDDLRSWPSGHTAAPFAIVGATLGLWLLPSGTRPRFAYLFAASTAVAVTTMVLRMVAGAHDAVDTTSGAALGLVLGFATTAMHLGREGAPRVSLGASSQAVMLTVRGTL